MTTCGWLAALALAFAAILANGRIADAGAAASKRPSIVLPDRGYGGLLALPGGRTVLWRNNGRLQIRSGDGSWSPLIDLGLVLYQVMPGPAGILARAERESADRTGHPTVVSLDTDGKALDRWEVNQLRDVASADGRVWGTAFGERSLRWGPVQHGNVETNPRRKGDRLLELVRGGRIEERGALETDATIAAFHVGPAGPLRIDCFPENEFEGGSHVSYCVAVGDSGWRKIGSWDRLPFPCGAYLIEIFDPLARAGMRARPSEKTQITVRRLENGTVAMERPLTPGRLIVCGAPGELLVARNDVEGWSLPELKPLWKRHNPQGAVTALARVGDELLLATGSGAFVTLRQPQAPAPPTNAATPQKSQDSRAASAK